LDKNKIETGLKRQVLDKIACQWKTLKKAFMDLNARHDGSIKREELKYFLDHWGL
jgi:inorganic triphosphatase YgiF